MEGAGIGKTFLWNALAGAGRQAMTTVPDLIYLTPGRIILVALVAIGLIWLAWQIIANTVGLNTATSSPETAVAWSSNEATALDELAQS